MPPPSNTPSLHLNVETGVYFVVQLPLDEPLPQWILQGLSGPSDFFSVTRTTDEISVVGQLFQGMPDGVGRLSTWSCIKIAGPMEHDLTGILASFAAPLKAAGIPIFAVSTWNTDYVLVPQGEVTKAKNALMENGWIFSS